MNPRLGGILIISVSSIIWGTTGTVATFASEAGPLAIGAAALGVGGLLQAFIALPAIRQNMPELRANQKTLLIGALAVGVYPLAFYSSMHMAGVAMGTVVSLGSAPLASGLLEYLVDRRSLSRWWMLAATFGILGSALLCLSKTQSSASDATSTLLGVGLGLIAGGTYAMYSWSAYRLMQRGVSRGASMGTVFGGGGAMLMPILFATGAPLVSSTSAFLVAMYMAVVAMFFGYLLFGIGLTRVNASTATTVTLTEPAVAAILAVVIVGERLSTIGWLGLGIMAMVMVLLAVAPSTSDDQASATVRMH